MANTIKSVLVTGATGGIGSATVARLAELGWLVYAGVREDRGEPPHRQNITRLQLDICDPVSIMRARSALEAQGDGRGLDALVNNAGISVNGPLELVPIDSLRRQLEVNVVGQVAVTQAMLPLLRAAHGRIVNIGGAAGRMTLPLLGALSASKAALDSLSDALRMELRHQGVRVCYIEPGAIRTSFFEHAAELSQRDGHAGTHDTQAIYASAIAATTKALADGHTDPPEAVVRAVVKALTARQPAPRYVVGREARLGLMLLPRLPRGMQDRILLSSVGISRDTFVTTGPARLST